MGTSLRLVTQAACTCYQQPFENEPQNANNNENQTLVITPSKFIVCRDQLPCGSRYG